MRLHLCVLMLVSFLLPPAVPAADGLPEVPVGVAAETAHCGGNSQVAEDTRAADSHGGYADCGSDCQRCAACGLVLPMLVRGFAHPPAAAPMLVYPQLVSLSLPPPLLRPPILS